MSDKSGIEWTDATWNPTVGCTKVSPGCDRCYAETFVNRFSGSKGFPNPFDQMLLRGERFLTLPLRWKEPRRIFVNSLSDLFHADVPDGFIAEVFAVMAACPEHTFQVLTKRHGRMRSLLSSGAFFSDLFLGSCEPYGIEASAWPLPNVWLGVSAEDQKRADLRIPALLATPAAVRWISAEPLLGPLVLDEAFYGLINPEWTDQLGFLDWVVTGGESGTSARPIDPDWVRSIRDQCANAGVAFLHKQWGGRTPKANGRELDGRTHDDYPSASPVAAAVASPVEGEGA